MHLLSTYEKLPSLHAGVLFLFAVFVFFEVGGFCLFHFVELDN